MCLKRLLCFFLVGKPTVYVYRIKEKDDSIGVPMQVIDPSSDPIVSKIHEMIQLCGGVPNSFEGDLLTQQIQNTLKLLNEGHDIGQLKLMTRSLKEMRYAYRIFNDHTASHRISIFGSART